MDIRIRCVCPPVETGPDDVTEVRHPLVYGTDAKGKPTDEVVGGGDLITFRDRLDFDQAMSCKQAVRAIEDDDSEASEAMRMAALDRQYLFVGIESWSLMNGKAIPVSATNIRQYILSDFAVASALSDKAERLYNGQVLIPLLGPASTFSVHTPTAGLTSVTKASTSKHRKPSSRSSTSTTRTADTGATT